MNALAFLRALLIFDLTLNLLHLSLCSLDLLPGLFLLLARFLGLRAVFAILLFRRVHSIAVLRLLFFEIADMLAQPITILGLEAILVLGLNPVPVLLLDGLLRRRREGGNHGDQNATRENTE